MKSIILAGLFILYCAHPLYAGKEPYSEKNFKVDVCKKVEHIIPFLQESTKILPKKCDPELLYYGYRSKQNDEKTFICANINKSNEILMMIYANGSKAVSTNKEFALHFACLIDDNMFNINKLIHDILLLKNKQLKKKNIDIYNYALIPVNSINIPFYDEITKKIDLNEERNYENIIVQQFSNKEKLLYERIQKIKKLYFRQHLEYETYRHASASLDEEITLHRQYIILLKKISLCRVHEYQENQYLIEDQKLNKYYKKITSYPEESYYLISTIKQTEKTWLQYKILLETLGQLHCPQINKYTWSFLLTQQRAQQLNEVQNLLLN